VSLRKAAALAWRDLRGGIAILRVLVICIALGVAAIAAIGSVRASIGEGLAREGAALLGGDAEIELTYRFATEAELAWMEAAAEEVSAVVGFRSMAVAREDRALTEVKAVDGAYPLYGDVELSPPMPLDAVFAGAEGLPGAALDGALAARLGLAPGDTFALGAQDFRVMALIEALPDAPAFALAPATLVARDALEGSGLLAPGTLFETAYRLRLPPAAPLDAVRAEAEAAIGPGLRWRDARDGAPGMARFVDSLGAFLTLVALAGLVTGGVGVSAALRAHLARRSATIATLKTFGATGGAILAIYGIQVALLTALAIAAGLVAGALAPAAFAYWAGGLLPVAPAGGIFPAALAQAALFGALMAAIFALWPLARARALRPAALFRAGGMAPPGRPGAGWLVLLALLVAALGAAAAWFTAAPALAGFMLAGIAAAFALLWLAGLALLALSRRAARAGALRGRPAWRIALGGIGAPGGAAMGALLSLGLGLSVLAAIGQTDANLRAAISAELPEVAPAWYVVDIQPAQIEAFRAAAEADPGVSRIETAPMLRGVITSLAGRPAAELDHWVLRGDRGLTYAETPPPGTRLTAGQWWPEGYSGPPQFSMAAEPAGELGLALGDEISVNVLGREIAGTITSFREVDFSGAGMGFILAVNPAALAGAPHSHIATLYAAEAGAGGEAGDSDGTATLVRHLSREMPNITAIRVRDAIDRAAGLLEGIAAAAAVAAGAVLVTGAAVLIGSAAAEETARRREAALLKTLGASRGQVLGVLLLRTALIGLIAGAAALLAGTLAAWAVVARVMELDFTLSAPAALLPLGLGLALTLLTGWRGTSRALRVSPAGVLREP